MNFKNILKTLLFSVAILLIGCLGVAAEGEDTTESFKSPTYYINESGTPTPLPSNITKLTPIQLTTEGKTNTDDTQTGATSSLTTETGENWYWAGSSNQATISKAVTAPAITITAPNTSGEINIVVGPNGQQQAPALTVQGGLKIPDNVTVKIYQAAYNSASGQAQPKLENCYLEFQAQAASSKLQNSLEEPTETPQIGIEVENGGALEVISGAINGVGVAGSTGLQVDAGAKATITGGQLQGSTPTVENGSPAAGITIQPANNGISAGTLTVSGGLLFSSVGSGTATTQTPIGNTISGIPTYSGGTIWSSDTVPTTGNGVWIQNSSTSPTRNITAFGTGGTFNAGVYELAIDKGTFTVPEGTTVDINSGLVFINGGTMTVNGNAIVNTTYGVWFDAKPTGETATVTSTGGSTLMIGNNGVFIIAADANVTLGNLSPNNPSKLENSGTIDVKTTSEQ